jgi:uncharacterized protein (TIGR04255 family)
MIKLPKKITPTPIMEALVELRFLPNIPSDAVFGVVFNAFKEKYHKVEGLPILQLPEALRAADPNLLYKPTHKFLKDNFILQVGPRVIALSNIKDYVGWDIFNGKIIELLESLFAINFIKSYEMIFLRVIDFFHDNIYDNSNLQITLNGEPFGSINKNFISEIQDSNYIQKLQISDRAEIELGGHKLIGSVIDIQTQLLLKDSGFREKYKEIIADIHLKQKILFFTLLKDEFIESLNPEY